MIKKIFITLALCLGVLMPPEDQKSEALITNERSGSWTSMSMTGAPSFEFIDFAGSVGNKLIVLCEEVGGIYDPGTDSWALMSMTGAPSFEFIDFRVPVGNKLVVLGHTFPVPHENVGGIYYPMVNDLIIENQTLNTTETFTACGTIAAGPAVNITPTGDVTFQAGVRVILRSGFSVEDGGRLSIVIDPSTCP